jgi:hypothetical protein
MLKEINTLKNLRLSNKYQFIKIGNQGKKFNENLYNINRFLIFIFLCIKHYLKKVRKNY